MQFPLIFLFHSSPILSEHYFEDCNEGKSLPMGVATWNVSVKDSLAIDFKFKNEVFDLAILNMGIYSTEAFPMSL